MNKRLSEQMEEIPYDVNSERSEVKASAIAAYE